MRLHGFGGEALIAPTQLYSTGNPTPLQRDVCFSGPTESISTDEKAFIASNGGEIARYCAGLRDIAFNNRPVSANIARR
jgi:hypothetical protein